MANIVMKYSIRRAVLLALGASLVAGVALAAEPAPQKAAPAKASAANASAAKPGAAKAKAPAREVVLVDINSASKEELKKLPQVGDAEADRIIAGRPYLTKAHLQTHKVLSPSQYQQVRELVVARQKDAKFGKAAK